MTDQEYRTACLEADIKQLREAVQKYMTATKAQREANDKTSRYMKPIWDAEKEINNILSPVRTVKQQLFEGQ